MAAGLFLAFIDNRGCSSTGWIEQAGQLGRVDGVSSVRTYGLSSAQVPLPGSLAVEHTGLIACTLDDVASSSGAVVDACWSSLEVPPSAGYFYEVARERRTADDASDGGRTDCYISFTNPGAPDRLEDFHEWYDSDHVPALLSVPGIHSATRYRRLADSPVLGSASFGDFEYMAFYETDTDVAAKALGAALAGAAEAGLEGSTGDAGMPVTDAVAFDRYIQVFYEAS